MKLLVDVGNSRIKWGVLHDSEIKEANASGYEKVHLPEVLEESWCSLETPSEIHVANVAGGAIAEYISLYTLSRWNIKPNYAAVTHSCAGVRNAYDDVDQLGIDRWLAILMAWQKTQSITCVVSCGTAITIDGIDGEGQHLGGIIVPGLNLMQDSLLQGTHGINIRNKYEAEGRFGNSTPSCVSNGAVYTVSSLVDRVLLDMEKEHGQEVCRIMTGGDAETINSFLKMKFEIDANLVLSGLALIAGPVS